MLPACWVQSINGLSEAEFLGSDKDQIFDTDLLGTWSVTIDGCVMALNVTANGKGYHWYWPRPGVGERCDKDKGDAACCEAELFTLDDHRFVDLTARSADVCEMCGAIHWIFLVQADENSFSLTPIDSDWLKNAEAHKS